MSLTAASSRGVKATTGPVMLSAINIADDRSFGRVRQERFVTPDRAEGADEVVVHREHGHADIWEVGRMPRAARSPVIRASPRRGYTRRDARPAPAR